MIYVGYFKDKEGGLSTRLEARPEHFRFVIENKDRFVFGGPLRDSNGQPVGSMYAVHADSLEDARAFIGSDPYMKAGLFGHVEIHAWAFMVPEQEPGFLEAELERSEAARLSSEKSVPLPSET
ncbi:MAG: YciI family protein [Thalassobaculaceae bacterium]|nr:YciI family protein [Thalassobaculaceae bacterium]